MSDTRYRGRFAPTPSGLLHAGSLATALGSWLDARAADGVWLIRMEDLDTPRNQIGADTQILQQLAQFGLQSDEPVIWQSHRLEHYQRALDNLIELELAYPCTCSRKSILEHLSSSGHLRERHQELIYPGFCRNKPSNTNSDLNQAHAWRAKVPDCSIHGQHLPSAVGDFILKRADGIFSYQLSVVLDDAAQGITHIVRGQDLLDNTPRQIWLAKALGFKIPQYLHLPLVCNEHQEKLSKQTQAAPVLPRSELEAVRLLKEAALHLGLPELPATNSVSQYLSFAVNAWPKAKANLKR